MKVTSLPGLAGFLLAIATVARCEIFERTEQLSGDDFVVTWIVDTEEKTVEFLVSAATKGWVGFGISPSGKMYPADVVIGGVTDANNEPYFSDRHTTQYGVPIEDDQQEWFLIAANQTETRTHLRFNRSFVTCDDNDISLTDQFTNFIWAMGDTDTLSKHQQRDFYSVYPLDPPAPASDVSGFERWDVFRNTLVPDRDTSYWCTVHKSPEGAKRHIVGYEVLLNTTEALDFTHHLILHYCRVESNSDESRFLDDLMKTEGGECYDPLPDEKMMTAVQFCETYYYVWAKGGKPFFTPPKVGLPLNDKNESEYFILEIHYDNPKVQAGVTYTAGLTVYTTPTLREIEGGLLSVIRDISWDFMVPPNTGNYLINSHCSDICLEPTLPKDGIQLYNVMLHSHLAGRKIKLRHFRNGTELPWILSDDYYNFDFQQNRPLQNEINVLPTDHLTVECTYETSGLNKPVWSGLSTRNEMCDAFIMYYPRVVGLDKCGSSVDDWDIIVTKFGIESFDNTTFLVDKPPEYAGLSYEEVLDTKVTWTTALIEELQSDTLNTSQRAVCWGNNNFWPPYPRKKLHHHSMKFKLGNANKATGDVYTNYPKDYVPYQAPDVEEGCKADSTTTTVDPGNGNTTKDPGNTTNDPGNTTEDPGNTTTDPGNQTADPGNSSSSTEDPDSTTASANVNNVQFSFFVSLQMVTLLAVLKLA